MVEPSRTSSQRATEDPNEHPVNNFVTSIHQVRLSEIYCHVTVTWAKTVISHSIYITVEFASGSTTPTGGENHYTCKIDLKTWQFWGKKGLKTFRVAEKKFDVFWDLRAAKFTSRPEPDSGYYVAMVAMGEMVLLLGDHRDDAVKRTKSKTCLEDTLLVHKKEIVYGKRHFSTRTTLGQNREHSITIEATFSGPCDPEMRIYMDGGVSIRVPNLYWRFRGNETIVVEGIPVEILWDVLGWLFYKGGSPGVGIFSFRIFTDEDELGGVKGFGAGEEQPDFIEFCHFVYACRI